MIKLLYDSMLFPQIPEVAKEYKYQLISYNPQQAEYQRTDGLYAFNTAYDWGAYLEPRNGCIYGLSEDHNAWEFHSSYDECNTVFNHTANINVLVTRDIVSQNGKTLFYASEHGTVEYGWWDGGEGDRLSIMAFTVPQGFHVAGAWKCIVSGADSPVAKMEWYKNGTLVSTTTGKAESECRPSADAIGTFIYRCDITFENGKSVTVGNMKTVVEAYDPGEDPGDDPGGGGGGGWDETSLVTGIDLHVSPDTVVPGGRATVEVTVNGIGNYSRAFTARLVGNKSSGTELFSAGNSCIVWIGEEETAECVTVAVASVQDPSVTATEMIYISHDVTGDEDPTQKQLHGAFWKGFATARAYFQEARVSVSASIHIAREEAEPTAKESKLRRSFWKGFVSALVVAASGTAPETIPEGVLISSDGYILKDSNGLYLCAMKGES